MLTNKLLKSFLLGGIILSGGAAFAQPTNSNAALLDLLVKKGVLTSDEAKELSAEIAKSSGGQDVVTNPTDSYVKRLTFNGRFQIQFADIGASIANNPINPVAQDSFLLRRVYFGGRVDFTNNLSAVLTYDFANASFDNLYAEWKQSDALVVDAGLKKAPFDYEEVTSSGSLKAIERSTVTRWFDEPNNGRRLGAASYRIGLYASGTQGPVFYQVAVTNPERNEYSGDGTSGPTVDGQSGVQTGSTAANNSLGYYGWIGLADKLANNQGSYRVGIEGGYLPDQGGPSTTTGQGNNLSLYGVFTDETFGLFNIQAEYLSANDPNGGGTNINSKPWGYWIQPSYYVIPKVLEAVVRYSYIDSDHRGVALSDGIRSSPSGGTMNDLDEWYIGGNWYIDGNDVKLQFGYIMGESKNSTALVAPAVQPDAKASGIRTQVQINF
jgi:hypothetical protein